MMSIREDRVLPEMLGAIPGKTSINNNINSLVDEKEEEKREQGKSFIPETNEYMKGFNAGL
jgi:hypothetical protein